MIAEGGTDRSERRPAARAFTLIEMLVAVGAVALVGVAIATVFEAVGKTVGVGKRMGTLNSYANLIQQQMERDFSSITRQGFLVIRNEMADADGDGVYDPPNAAGIGGDSIPLTADDLTPRPRRIDEIMFFSKGDFATAREALDPRFVVRSDAASIYYGMGKRRRSDAIPTGEYLRPTLNHTNSEQTLDSWLGQQVAGNPNRFASDWTLLRLVRVLAPSRSTVAMPPGTVVFGVNGNSGVLNDRDNQSSLQPAAAGLFRALNAQFPLVPTGVLRPGRPAFASGIVDVTTTSLEEARLIVTTADTWPGGVPSGFSGQPAGPQFFDPVTADVSDPNSKPDGQNAGVDGKSRWTDFTGNGASDESIVARMQAWMTDAWPAWSSACDDPASVNTSGRARVRYEPEPPNYLGVLADPNITSDLVRAEFRADQLMLSSSNFVPRCTEFMVEWSFGRTYPSETLSPNSYAGHEGQIIWHGMERLADGRPPSQVFTGTDSVARPFVNYPGAAAPWKPGAAMWSQRMRLNDGSYGVWPVNQRLIHGQGINPANINPGDPLTSYFGFTDPTFNPDKNNDGRLDSPGDAAAPTIPWPWPKLIRVTIGLADPNDPTFEQRYQFVFTLPEQPAP